MSLANPGESAAGIAAVEILLDHLLDDRPEEAAHLLEAALGLRQEALDFISILSSSKNSIEILFQPFRSGTS
jgi:hypothetical protein